MTHSFHIPVMGLAYTIDSPLRIAAKGIDSVISIVDDELVERMRIFFCKKLNRGVKRYTCLHQSDTSSL